MLMAGSIRAPVIRSLKPSRRRSSSVSPGRQSPERQWPMILTLRPGPAFMVIVRK